MKKIISLLIILLLYGSMGISYASASNQPNLNIGSQNTDLNNKKTNTALEEMRNDSEDILHQGGGQQGADGIVNMLLTLARDFKNIITAVVVLLGVIIVLRLFFGDNTDEEQKKLKTWFIWTSIGILLMQIAYSVYRFLFQGMNDSIESTYTLADKLLKYFFEPIQDLLILLGLFVFIAMGLVSFYKMITAGGDEEKAKKGRMTIVYAIIGFIIIKLSQVVVRNTLNINPTGSILGGVEVKTEITKNALIIFNIINWLNTFVAIVIVIMTIYAGVLVLTSGGDDEKISKAKRILLYIGIGLLILVGSYLILTFLSPVTDATIPTGP